MDMDVDTDIIRGISASSSKFSSRESSTHSTASSIPYHERMEIQNNLLNKDDQEPVDSSQLSYALSNGQVGNLVREATDTSPQKRAQYACNSASALNNTPKPQGC